MDVESILQSSLQPVSPRPEFIKGLHRDLMEYTFPQLESSEIDVKRPLIIALVGFVGLIFVFSIWVRLILLILTTIGMIKSSRRKK